MRKILLGFLITGIILAIFFTARPFAAGLLDMASSTAGEEHQGMIKLEPATQVSIIQGSSARALKLTNEADTPVSFSLGHAHAYLTLEPREDILAPGASRNITMHVDNFCPPGETELMIYLLAETEDVNFGMETVDIYFSVLPGELKLEQLDDSLNIIWNNAPAPPGVVLYYQDPLKEDWQRWGETPRIDLESPPSKIEPGNYSLRFMAKMGEIESEIETLDVVVNERFATTESEWTGSSATEEDPGPPKAGEMRHSIDYGDTELPREPATIIYPYPVD